MVESLISWAFLHRNPEPNSNIYMAKMLIDATTYASLLLNTVAHNETTKIALLVFTSFWYAAFLMDKQRKCVKDDPRLFTALSS